MVIQSIEWSKLSFQALKKLHYEYNINILNFSILTMMASSYLSLIFYLLNYFV